MKTTEELMDKIADLEGELLDLEAENTKWRGIADKRTKEFNDVQRDLDILKLVEQQRLELKEEVAVLTGKLHRANVVLETFGVTLRGYFL